MAAAVRGIRHIYRPGYDLIKAGVMLLDLQPASVRQGELDLDVDARDTTRLMSALDQINDRYGRGTLTVASAGAARDRKAWGMRQDRLTPQYTTCWDDVPIVRA